MTSARDIDFRTIRAHQGSQHRAWEELAYNLAPDLDQLPADTRLTRRGTPDGGIEFSCPAPPGRGTGTWAWQAKFLFDFRPSTFEQMKSSFEDALANTPQLSRYIFVLPEDRPAGAVGTSALKKWHEHTERWAKAAAERGASVEFEFHGHSDVLSALLRPHHVGAARYFFDASLLSSAAMTTQVSKAVDDLGQRYDPDLNVKTDFPSLVSGLCLDQRFSDRVGRLLAEAENRASDAEHAMSRHADVSRSRSARPVDETGRPGGESPAPAHPAVDASLGTAAVAPDLPAGTAAGAIAAVLPKLQAVIARCRQTLDCHDTAQLAAARQVLSDCLDAVIADQRTHDERTRDPDSATALESGQPRVEDAGVAGEEVARPDLAPPLPDVRSALAKASSALSTAIRFLESRTAAAAEQRAVALVGPAGCGKSHSIADVALARLEAGAPTALVLGQQLTMNTSLGAEIGHFLQFDGSWGELLGALQVAAQVAGKGRALLAIDAINEGPGADLWATRLGGFLNEISRYPMVAVLVSVRDTYESALITEPVRGKVVRAVHRGLAGHESEAVQLYADHYGLRVTNIPLLHPEFSNPLLLRSICRSAQNRGLTDFPTSAVSQHWVFDGLLDAVNENASAALDRDSHDRPVHQAVRGLAECMLDLDSEAISYDEARRACRAVHDDHGRASHSLLAVLEGEGILLRERVPQSVGKSGDPAAPEQVRFTYQRMSDHLRAQALLSRNDDDGALVAAIGAMLADRAWRATGLIEALSALVPDGRGRDLIDLVSNQSWFDDSRHQLAGALLDSLIWRSPSTIDDRTVELVREHVRAGYLENHDWLSTLLSLACVPDHPLNIDFLHPRLVGWTLIERDTAWSQPITWIWQDDDNPVARTIDWLWGSCERLDAVGAELVGRLMTWLLSCTSRRLRDSATKLLVEVADRRPETLLRLLHDFADIDDPYIRERLMAASLGHATRLPERAPTPRAATLLAETHEAAMQMAADAALPPHALITHYANQLTYECRRRLPGAVLSSYSEPSADWPLEPPTNAELRSQLGDATNRYLPSSPVMYDFREYILKRGICRDFVPPGQPELRRRRKANAKARYGRAVRAIATATNRSTSEVDRILTTPEREWTVESLGRLRSDPDSYRKRPPSPSQQLQADQPELFFRANRARQEYTSKDPVRVSADILERHVIARALELGWRPADQGGPDSFPIYESRSGQAQDKIERIGKKYSWIAFHELIAVLGQHCLVQRWNDSEELYESIWQLSHVYDIDPTITLRGDSPAADSASARLVARTRAADQAEAWWLEGFRSPMRQPTETDQAWLRDRVDLPNPHHVLTAQDPSGDTWVALEAHTEWQIDTPGAAYESRPHRRDMWIRSQSYVMPTSGRNDVRDWSAGRNWMGLWMPTPPDYGPGYYRQYPLEKQWRAWATQLFEERSGYDALGGAPRPYDPSDYLVSDGWTTPTRRGFPAHPIALTTLGHTANAEVDMSAKNLPRGLLPSPLLLDLLGAAPTPVDAEPNRDCIRLGLGAVERAYSWSNSEGVVMFGTDGDDWGAPMALFVRVADLAAALASRGLTWWTWILGEKISWQHGDPTGDRLDMFGAAGLEAGVVDVWHFDARFYGRGGRDDEADD